MCTMYMLFMLCIGLELINVIYRNWAETFEIYSELTLKHKITTTQIETTPTTEI